jgi:hypothetical protein
MSATAAVKPDTRKRELQKRLAEIESGLAANEQRAGEQRRATVAERERLNRERNETLAALANIS